MKLGGKNILINILCNGIAPRRSIHDVRVRFAPSPTGYLHLGGLRTALYNFLFAMKNNGKFILRIEDTDQTRLVSDASCSLIEDLEWSGIVIDEGPTKEGNFGPYIQSQRVPIYNEAINHLLETETAYRCFCSETRLDLLRKQALKLRQVPRYDNKCRHITLSQLEEKLNNKLPYCIRFKLEDHPEPVQDLIYGNVLINSSTNEGDPVIMKTDGFPTYHFANVVDDHYMKISHVFRGVEWQTSTTKHLQLYKAFGWNPPKFGHLPLLINADGTKLSKRQGDVNIKSFRDNGIFPLALVNYVMCAGGGFQREHLQKPALESLHSLSKKFDIECVNSHPGRLNPDLLDDFNNMEIRRRLSNEDETNELVETVQKMILLKYPENKKGVESSYVKNILKWSVQRLARLSDLTSDKLSFLWTDGSPVYSAELNKDQIQELIAGLETTDFSKNNIQKTLKSFSEKNKIKFPVLMKTLRSVLSGLKEGPGVAEVMEIFGKEDCLRRIRSNLNSNKLH